MGSLRITQLSSGALAQLPLNLNERNDDCAGRVQLPVILSEVGWVGVKRRIKRDGSSKSFEG
jgi:hypothetical protein